MKNLTINSLLTESLTNKHKHKNQHKQLTCIFSIVCIIYHILTIKEAREKKLRKSQRRENTVLYIVFMELYYTVFMGKNMLIGWSVQFISILFMYMESASSSCNFCRINQ